MSLRPVFGIDIDGTLGWYHEHFLTFSEQWLGRAVPRHYDGSVPLCKWIGVSKQRYREIKLRYRMGGLKRSMPALPAPYPDASYLTRLLAQWGADVWLCTTRPYLAHDNIDGDTREWVRRNGVRSKGVIWGEHKYRELVRTVGRARIAGVLDDDAAMCQQARMLELPTAFALRPHNSAEEWGGEHMLEDSEETVQWFKARLIDWRTGYDSNSDARRG